MREAVATADQRDRDGDRVRSGSGVTDRYVIWPIAKVDGEWNVPDALLVDVWKKLYESGKAKTLFYNGGVTNEWEFIEYVKSPANFPILIVDSGKKAFAAFAWLNNVLDGGALAHFAIFGIPRPEIGKAALKFWKNLPGIQVIVGNTPEHYVTAWKYAKAIGFTIVGTIPRMCNMVYEGRRVGGVLSYYTPNPEE